MAYGKIKADTLVFDNSGSDVDLVVSEIVTAAGVTFTGNVNFDDQVIVKGDSTNGSGALTLNCENNTHGIKIKGPPHSAGANYTLTLPNNTGTNGQVLITNGSGVSSWSTIDLSSKLSLAGGQMTGNITFSGSQTVDGRNLSVDGTKLDGIETAATADQTAAEILTAIKTVDGASSGLDADLLDGQHGAYYTGYVDTAIANLIDSAPATLDTLNELAAALGDDPNFATTVTNSIATKLPLAGGTLTGGLTGTTGTFVGVGELVLSQSTVGQSATLFLGKGGPSKVFSVDESGNLKIGSNIDSAGTTNISLNTTGSATFAGSVKSTNGTGSAFLGATSGTGLAINNSSNATVVELNYDGNATFAGNIDIDGGTSGTSNAAGVSIYKNNSNASYAPLYISQGNTSGNLITGHNAYSGAVTFAVGVNGNATFAGSMTVTGTGQYTGAQRGGITTTAGFGGFTFNFNASNNYQLNLVGASTLNNPTNQVAGQHGVILVTQDGTGGRTLAFGTNWKFPGGTAPTLSTAANSQDLLAYYVPASGTILAQLITDLK